MICEIVLSGGVLRYELTRKRVRRINLRVRPDGSVAVSASARVPLEVIESFLRKKENFLMEAIKKTEEKKREIFCAEGERIPYLGGELTLHFEKSHRYSASVEGERLSLRLREPEDLRAREAAVLRWKKETCAELAKGLMRRWYPVARSFGVPEPELRFRDMSSRWGSCIPEKKIVTLNTRLLEFPQACMEYVLVHELCHFLQPDHSPAFYGWLDRFLPDWRERRKKLR